MIPCVVGKRMGIVQWAKDGFAYVIQPGEFVDRENCFFTSKIDFYFISFIYYFSFVEYHEHTKALDNKWIESILLLLFIFSGGSIVGYPRLKLEGDQNAGVYNLTIKDASLTDDGEYQCQVGPYGKIRAIRANAHLVVICKY